MSPPAFQRAEQTQRGWGVGLYAALLFALAKFVIRVEYSSNNLGAFMKLASFATAVTILLCSAAGLVAADNTDSSKITKPVKAHKEKKAGCQAHGAS